MKRIINLSVEINDSDFEEKNFCDWANGNMNITYIRTLPNTSHLREDKVYQKMVKDKRDLTNKMQDYIWNNKK